VHTNDALLIEGTRALYRIHKCAVFRVYNVVSKFHLIVQFVRQWRREKEMVQMVECVVIMRYLVCRVTALKLT